MPKKIRVLLVDDSAFARSVISKKLSADPELEVIDFAADGVEALEKVKSLRPDVVTLDVTMPRMDGLMALELIMGSFPTPVVMLSALTGEQSQATIEALEKGAVDFFLKPSALNSTRPEGDLAELIEKIKAASTVSGVRLKTMATWNRTHRLGAPAARRPRPARLERVVVIGVSTGGPRALAELIPQLPAELPAGVLLVQHMPPTFTRSLAQRLDQSSPLEVKEAQTGDTVTPGLILLAPGGYHLTVNRQGTVALDQSPPECGVRPSVNVTMESAARAYGRMVLGVVLTGMGYDGTRGAGLIRDAGGQVLAEHESTCAIYGMPKSVIERGLANQVVPLDEMAQEISARCGLKQPQQAEVRG